MNEYIKQFSSYHTENILLVVSTESYYDARIYEY